MVETDQTRHQGVIQMNAADRSATRFFMRLGLFALSALAATWVASQVLYLLARVG